MGLTATFSTGLLLLAMGLSFGDGLSLASGLLSAGDGLRFLPFDGGDEALCLLGLLFLLSPRSLLLSRLAGDLDRLEKSGNIKR